jgi:hypothetical protein
MRADGALRLGFDPVRPVLDSCSQPPHGVHMRNLSAQQRPVGFFLAQSVTPRCPNRCWVRLAKLLRLCGSTRASGGIGRRAGFRCQYSQGCGGSSPPSPTAQPLLSRGFLRL